MFWDLDQFISIQPGFFSLVGGGPPSDKKSNPPSKVVPFFVPEPVPSQMRFVPENLKK